MKKLVLACYDKVIEFDTKEEAEIYIKTLEVRKKDYSISNKFEYQGKYRLRVQEQYNNVPLLKN